MRRGPESTHIRSDVVEVGEEAVTLLETLTRLVVAKAPPAEPMDSAVWYLTICGMHLAQEHARGAVAEFSAGRSYAGIALDRCLFEAMVRTMDWNLRPEFAFACWKALPAFAAREEVRRVGGKPNAPLVKNTVVPPGVQRHIAEYLAQTPEAELTREASLLAAAETTWATLIADATQLRSLIFSHIDTPSLFVHCRALVAEDLFDVSSDTEWAIREVSLMAEPNARVLEIARLLMHFCNFVAPRFGYDTATVDRVFGLWSIAVDRHETQLGL